MLNFITVVPMLSLLLGNGCCPILKSQAALDSVGRYYIAIEPTEKVYLTKDRAYVEFRKAYYTDYVPISGECVHFLNLVIDHSKPTSLVYLEMDKNYVQPRVVARQVSNNLTNLLERKVIISKLTKPVDFPNAAGFDDDCWTRWYPELMESHQSALWYIVSPLQVPAFVVDVGVTLAAVPVFVVYLPFKCVWKLFADDNSKQSSEPTGDDK